MNIPNFIIAVLREQKNYHKSNVMVYEANYERDKQRGLLTEIQDEAHQRLIQNEHDAIKDLERAAEWVEAKQKSDVLIDKCEHHVL